MKKWEMAKKRLSKEELRYVMKFGKGSLLLSPSEEEDVIRRKLLECGIKGRWSSKWAGWIYKVPNYFYEC